MLAQAAEVMAIGNNKKSLAITHDGERRWQPDDRVCVVQGNIDVVCGKVLKSTVKGAIVKLDTLFEAIQVGDPVRLLTAASTPAAQGVVGERKPATQLLDSVEKDRQAGLHRFNLGAGLSAGFSYLIPLLNLQWSPFRKVAIGLMPFYFKGSGNGATIQGFGGYASVSYYGQGHFRGLWIQGGGGIFNFSATDATGFEEKVNSPAGFLTVGYRGYYEAGLNIGIAAGGLFVTKPEFSVASGITDVKPSGIQPLLIVDIGYSF